jgi:Ca-activated chloride channel homolog
VGQLAALWPALRAAVADGRSLQMADLRYGHGDTARLALLLLTGLAAAVLVARSTLERRAGRSQIALPAVLAWARPSWTASLRHLPLLLFLSGLPFFILAVADPYTALARTEVAYPGRRIGLMIDASASMNARFYSKQFKRNETENTFFTTVSAAEFFVRQRMRGRYRDLVALVEFGDEAYVVTPFTNDYDNILLSLALVGDPTEFKMFPDKGTTIGLAIDQSVNLFRAFNYLDAAGNLMVIFSDGQDTQAVVRGTERVSDILAGAVRAKVPVYFIRTNYDKTLGALVPDELWKSAVESTGGRFYAASDEATILQAIREIDRLSTGTIQMKQYSSERPRFPPFGLAAVALWTCALALKLSLAFFNKFP